MSIDPRINQAQVQGQQNGMQGPTEAKIGCRIVKKSEKQTQPSSFDGIRKHIISMSVTARNTAKQINHVVQQTNKTATTEANQYGFLAKAISNFSADYKTKINEANRKLTEASEYTAESRTKVNKLNRFNLQLDTIASRLHKAINNAKTNDEVVQILINVKKQTNIEAAKIIDIVELNIPEFNQIIDTQISQFESLIKKESKKITIEQEINLDKASIEAKEISLNEAKEKKTKLESELNDKNTPQSEDQTKELADLNQYITAEEQAISTIKSAVISKTDAVTQLSQIIQQEQQELENTKAAFQDLPGSIFPPSFGI